MTLVAARAAPHALHLNATIALAIVIGALLADATNDPGP